MEVKMNKEIRNYTEAIFFGLSLRQFFFSVIACGFSVFLYFMLKSYLSLETLSWLCILAASPFAAMGFIRYHGMSAEQIAWAWIKSEIIMPKKVCYKSKNMYYELLKSKNTIGEKNRNGEVNDKDA